VATTETVYHVTALQLLYIHVVTDIKSALKLLAYPRVPGSEFSFEIVARFPSESKTRLDVVDGLGRKRTEDLESSLPSTNMPQQARAGDSSHRPPDNGAS
jgi:hypothetical protein